MKSGSIFEHSVSLIDFFKYYAREFTYNTGVISIRAGLLMKESKGWLGNEVSEKGCFCCIDLWGCRPM